MTRKQVFSIIEKAEEGNKASRIYDIFMLVMIITSVFPLAFWNDHIVFHYIEWICTSVFIADYLLRWFTADYKLEKGYKSFLIYPFSGWAIIDLISILPSFSFIGKGFRLVRTIRLFKLLRLLKAIRYSSQIVVLLKVLQKEKKVLYSVLVIAIIYILITALIMFNCEPRINPNTGNPTFRNYFDALYWATVTLTTVGYGDLCPVSELGRFVGMLSAIFGIAIIALPSGIITASYMDELKEAKGEQIDIKIRNCFRRTLVRETEFHPSYYVVPRRVPVVNIEVKKGIDIATITERVDKAPDMRLRNLATTIPTSEKPVDRVAVECFPVNRPYGCFIDRGSNVTIVSPCSYAEACIGNTAYYLSLIGGFNYISKEYETDPDQPVSFYNIPSDAEDSNLDAYLNDIKSLGSGKDKWFISLISTSSANGNYLHFAHGRIKGDNGYSEEQKSTVIDTESYEAFYEAIEAGMMDKFEIGSKRHVKYTLTGNYWAYKFGAGRDFNAFTIRMPYSLTCWDEGRYNKIQLMAEVISEKFAGKALSRVEDMHVKKIGF